MRVLQLSSFFSGSHRAVAEGYAAHSGDQVDTVSLPGRLWRQRLRWSGALLAERVRAKLKDYQLVLAHSPTDLSQFRALAGHPCPPVALYLHENQLTSPFSKRRPRDSALVHIDLNSALVADHLLFNSQHHRDSFLDAIARERSLQGDVVPRGLLTLRRKAHVLPPGIHLEDLPEPRRDDGPPAVVWNQRWDPDRDPDTFIEVFSEVAKLGAPFRLILLGPRPSAPLPAGLERARTELSAHIWHDGHVADRKTYLGWLAKASFHVSTSLADTFSTSGLEAVAAGARPIWPAEYCYKELLPPGASAQLYSGREELLGRVLESLNTLKFRQPDEALMASARARDWHLVAPFWDRALERLVSG